MNSKDRKLRRDVARQNCLHWALTLITVSVVGMFVFPFLRVYPKSVHGFILGLAEWQRILFIFTMSVLFAEIMFRLLTPRWAHLRHIRICPPTWLAWLAALMLVVLKDWACGLGPDGYAVTIGEWYGYGGAALATVGICRWPAGVFKRKPKVEDTDEKAADSVANLESADWIKIEEWLQSDEPAKNDLLGNRVVAERLAGVLGREDKKFGTIGIVGPFGAGKTTIIEWIESHIKKLQASDGKDKPTIVFSKHKCWGFEDSALAIHAMLADAVDEVGRHVDTFRFRSLPDSYRQVFSACGTWVDTVSNLIFKRHGPVEQLGKLSELLGAVNIHLIFVVEDLDRNDSRCFDIQEVLGLLQRIKDQKNISFILTGGLNSTTKIDFSKLCDHIEYLKSVDVRDSSKLVKRLRDRCFEDERLGYAFVGEKNEWVFKEWPSISSRANENLSLIGALTKLLNTPRALRHAISRTLDAWKSLKGEVDFDQLLVINVLRFGAPECFDFLLTEWERLSESPPRERLSEDQLARMDPRLRAAWETVTEDAEWDVSAALVLLTFILPATAIGQATAGWPERKNAIQGVQKEKYWRRAINEAIDQDDVSDQEVVRDIKQWRESLTANSALVAKLHSDNAEYSEAWENLARVCLIDHSPEEILLLCEQILARIREQYGSAANSGLGFEPVWNFVTERFPGHLAGRSQENRVWIEQRISEAAFVSLWLVRDLWRCCGGSDTCLLEPADRIELRRYMLQILKERLIDAESLTGILDIHNLSVLYQLMSDPLNSDEHSIQGVKEWNWLAPVLREGLHLSDPRIVACVRSLVRERDANGIALEPWKPDQDILAGFFGDADDEVLEILRQPSVAENDS